MARLRSAFVGKLLRGVAGTFIVGLVAQIAPGEAQKAPKVSADVAAATSPPEATTASYGDWVLRCRRDAAPDKPAQMCEVTHSVVVQGQSGPILQIAVGRLAPGPLKFTVVLPHHVQLDQGPRVGIENGDAAAAQLTWRRCLPVGCFADSDLAAATQQQFSNAEKGTVTFVDGSGRPVPVPFSLKGFKAALQALEKQ